MSTSNKIRRVNFFAGPGAGKTTVAARAFAEIKMRGYDAEHIAEFVKTMAHEGRFPQSMDQVHIFGEQIHREDVALRHVDVIVTDCPMLMCCAYALMYDAPGAKHLVEIAKEYDQMFPALNLCIERTVDYVDKGRYQNLDQAREFDKHMVRVLDEHVGDWTLVRVDDFVHIMDIIEERLNGSNT